MQVIDRSLALTHVETGLEVQIESICRRGCRQVWEAIGLLERGEDLPETQALCDGERFEILTELKSIMAVYGNHCRIG